MTSKIKVDNIANQSDSNIVNKCGTTITLGASGDTIALASGASQTGFGRTGTVDWDTTPKTATFSAVSGNGYFCNTSGGAFTVNLPAGSAGAIVSLADYAATWQTNNLTVSPNGTDKIGSINSDVILNTEGQSVTFVYVDSTQGWLNTMDSTSNVRGTPFIVATGGTITECGDFKIHTFTGPGTFTVTNLSTTPAENTVGYMVVAGGGGGGLGATNSGGGGGAGGFREGRNVPIDNFTASPLVADAPTNAVTVTATSFPITVGGGGGGITLPSNGQGNPGSNSVFSTIISAGGGGGGSQNNSSGVGLSGGSGGGAAFNSGGASGGSGNTPSVSPAQGNDGGDNAGDGGSQAASGGGGAAAAGSGAPQTGPAPSRQGNGGNGVASSITGSSVTRAGGGGGNISDTPACGGASGGTGGGGPGGTAGTVNTGGGGGGGSTNSTSSPSGSGGSGIVIIRYKFQ